MTQRQLWDDLPGAVATMTPVEPEPTDEDTEPYTVAWGGGMMPLAEHNVIAAALYNNIEEANARADYYSAALQAETPRANANWRLAMYWRRAFLAYFVLSVVVMLLIASV